MPSAVISERPSSPSLSPLPQIQTAITQDAQGNLIIAHDVPLPVLLGETGPQLSDAQILIKVHAVALNPTDWKMHRNFPVEGAIAGCDFAGEIVALPPATAASGKWELRVGDRVAGCVHGSNRAQKSNGAFAEYVLADAALVLRVPRAWTWEQAAAFGGIGWGTMGMALFEGGLGLQWNPGQNKSRDEQVLVYGGGTATGALAIQLLLLAGYQPLTTCSPASMEALQAYGMPKHAMYDYHDATTLGSSLRGRAPRLKFALDCITTPTSTTFCYASLSRAGGCYTCLEAPDARIVQSRKAVQCAFVMGYEMFGMGVDLPGVYGRTKDLSVRERIVRWRNVIQNLVDNASLSTQPIKNVEGRWQGIIKGLEDLENGIRGVKLVVRLIPEI